MQDAPPPAVAPALAGRTVTPELVDAARRHLVMLRALHEDLRRSVPALCPAGSGAWRSAAADHYVERLDYLRTRLVGAVGCLADAAAALDERIRRMQAQLDAQLDSRLDGRFDGRLDPQFDGGFDPAARPAAR